jgi:hypothetical protein
MGLISYSVCPWQAFPSEHFHPSLIFPSKRLLPTLKDNNNSLAMLKMLARNKRSSLFALKLLMNNVFMVLTPGVDDFYPAGL